VTGIGGKEIPAPNGTVCSPYFHPWQPTVDTPNNIVLDSCSPIPPMGRADLGVGSPRSKFAFVNATGYCSTGAEVDTSAQPVKLEVPFDSARFGHMPEDLTTSTRTYSNMLPLPDIKPRFSWHPANL